MKPTIAVDFDGVLHSYTTPWSHALSIPDAPVEGAFAWLREAVKLFSVVVYSTRASQSSLAEVPGLENTDPDVRTAAMLRAFEEWFLAHGLERSVLYQLTFDAEKPKAIAYLDDRAWRFEGPDNGWPAPYTILKSKTWQNR